MVNVYLRDEIELELLMMAQQENAERCKQNKKMDITKGKILARIVEDWYRKRVDAEKILRETYGLTGKKYEALEKGTKE